MVLRGLCCKHAYTIISKQHTTKSIGFINIFQFRFSSLENFFPPSFVGNIARSAKENVMLCQNDNVYMSMYDILISDNKEIILQIIYTESA